MDPVDPNEAYSTNTNAAVSTDDLNSSPSSDHQFFSIDVECKIFSALNGVLVDGLTDTIQCGITIVPKEDIERFIYMLFSYFDVPENAQPRMAAKILACTEEIVNESPKNKKILDLYIVLAHISQIQNYNDIGLVDESITDSEDMRLVPASKSSIEGLEKVNVDEQKEGSAKGRCDCAICFEDFSIDSEAVRMPCFHLFHRTCITRRLHHRNTCPLCRFQMPTENDDDHDGDDDE
ncbi:uncharacterized protein LOC129305392 [Prosopis cineraria]|uniref:uncharacterized protein LOC129305392 n=1 Tax=Prosopis cineraria TaxID=364024 RepID=UPI00240F4273|nr:uncharacterized protein LOC129305392 [Prosopis cineraria]